MNFLKQVEAVFEEYSTSFDDVEIIMSLRELEQESISDYSKLLTKFSAAGEVEAVAAVLEALELRVARVSGMTLAIKTHAKKYGI